MASLYDSASLVMIPSGVKDGKVYSIKPTDGSGDFTFSRGTDTATRVNSSGLIEKERANLLLQSNAFNTTWVNSGTITRTSGQSGYDGSSDAWLLTKGSSGAFIRQNISQSGVRTFSLYAKADTSTWLLLVIDGSPDAYQYIDLANGVLGATGSNVDSTIISVGGGWYRCTITGADSYTQVRIYPAEGNGNVSGTTTQLFIQDAQLEQGLVATDYIETTTSAVYEGITDNLPRLDYSGGASCPSLLLEPQRSNLVVNSEYANSTNWSNGGTTYSNNQATSPEGVNNAIKLIEDNSTAFHYLGSDISGVTTAGTYSISGFIKKGTRKYGGLRAVTNGYINRYFVLVDLDDGSVADTYTQGSGVTWSYDIKDYGNGWYRIEISGGHTSGTIGATFSPSDTASPTYFGALPDYNGSTGEHIFCYGLQAELGSYATSYIPCNGTSASRAADSCGIQNSNLSTVIGQSEGVIFADLDFVDSSSTADHRFSVSSGSSQNWIFISLENGDRLRYYIRTANTQAVDSVVTSQFTAGNRYKIAFRYDSGNNAVFINGAKVQDNSTTFTGPDSNLIRYNISGTTPDSNNSQADILSKVKQSILFDTPLTDAECITLTTL